ncbi:MAG: signal peptidase I [Terriglobales bacterium]
MTRTAKLLVLATLIATLLSLAFQVVVVPTASMEGTVLVGDHLLIDRFAYGPQIPFTHVRLPRLKAVRRGDVVSFHPPERCDEVYMKRVVAVGGDRVQWRDGMLYINGNHPLDPYTQSPGMEQSPELVVPAGEVYLLGDNRRHSEDSRAWGTVPESNVIGEPVLVLWSIASPTQRWLRSQFAVYLDHPIAHLRWDRFFQRVQ